MTTAKITLSPNSDTLKQQLVYLKLTFMLEHYEPLATDAATASWTHVNYMAHLVDGEALLRQERATTRRLHNAHFPLLKELDHNLTGPGRKRSIVLRCRISSGCASSTINPT